MRCIIVDDEPLAREAVEMLVSECDGLSLVGKFNSAASAGKYMQDNEVDLVFLDIQMPGVTGLEFARTIPRTTLVIFTTAYAEYALESYDVEAIDYLVKPVMPEKFQRAVDKAIVYHKLLISEGANDLQTASDSSDECFFVKSERRFFKISYADILFIEGLKDYIIIQMKERKVITKMTIKSVEQLLPTHNFIRVNRSYIVNTDEIDSFDTNDIYIGKYEIAIGISYKEDFFGRFLKK